MLFETLGIVSQDLSPAKREYDTRAYTDKRYLDSTISKQALRDLKFEWKQLKKFIVQCTMENALNWCDTQAAKQHINQRKYHRLLSSNTSQNKQQAAISTSTSSTSTTTTSSMSSTSASGDNVQSVNSSTEQEF